MITLSKNSCTLSQNNVELENKVNVKLANIYLSNSDRKIENWCNFKLPFDNLFTKNLPLNNMQQLFYLWSTLKDEAKYETPEDALNLWWIT